MGKIGTERRVHPREFKAEAVSPAEKREKPISQVAADLGFNESILRRWIHEAHAAAGSGIQAVSRPWTAAGDAELARLRKGNKALRDANEILKKAAAIFAQGEPR